MVQIREQEEEPQQQHHVVSITQHQYPQHPQHPQHPQQQQQRNQPSSHTTLNNQTTMNPSSSSSHPPPHTTTDSPNSSPSSISSDHTFHGFSPKPSSPNPSPPIQALVPINRLVRDQTPDTVTVTKTEPKAETGFAARREIPLVNTPKRRKLVKSVGFVLRFLEFVVCLVSFSVMAADKNRGWALDSFDHYTEFRYSMSVNVIGFAYSGLQGLDLLYQLTTGKKSRSQIRYSFDFAADQILAYLLLSASSSAFTRVDDWISNWGSDEFPAMASASVGVSFVAFIAFALSSLISGYLLCTHRFA